MGTRCTSSHPLPRHRRTSSCRCRGKHTIPTTPCGLPAGFRAPRSGSPNLSSCSIHASPRKRFSRRQRPLPPLLPPRPSLARHPRPSARTDSRNLGSSLRKEHHTTPTRTLPSASGARSHTFTRSSPLQSITQRPISYGCNSPPPFTASSSRPKPRRPTPRSHPSSHRTSRRYQRLHSHRSWRHQNPYPGIPFQSVSAPSSTLPPLPSIARPTLRIRFSSKTSCHDRLSASSSLVVRPNPCSLRARRSSPHGHSLGGTRQPPCTTTSNPHSTLEIPLHRHSPRSRCCGTPRPTPLPRPHSPVSFSDSVFPLCSPLGKTPSTTPSPSPSCRFLVHHPWPVAMASHPQPPKPWTLARPPTFASDHPSRLSSRSRPRTRVASPQPSSPLSFESRPTLLPS